MASGAAGSGRGRWRRAGRAWALTLGATVVSTYALDAVATGAGLALAASGLLAGAPEPVLALVLAASYVAWGLGLRAALRANWELLSRTGASTNALSKAAHALARRRSPRVQRLAASAGYVAVELAKEAPYYAGAFGAAAATDAVSARDALVFLAGANLGAALYELGLARLTLRVLRRRRAASFERDWVPATYLADYYGEVQPDERETIPFLVEAMRAAEPGEPVLVLGTGPTLHHVFLAAPRASELHLADYLPGNLAELERWRRGDPGAHDWRPFVRFTLECEGLPEPDEADVAAREDRTRAAITRLVQVDARRPIDLGRRYATVISAYCADSATDDRLVWEALMSHITALVRPGGLFITAALRRCTGYRVGAHRFPSADVDEHDLRRVLEPAFDVHAEVREVAGHDDRGYAGIVLARAVRTVPAYGSTGRSMPEASVLAMAGSENRLRRNSSGV